MITITARGKRHKKFLTDACKAGIEAALKKAGIFDQATIVEENYAMLLIDMMTPTDGMRHFEVQVKERKDA